MRNLPWDHPQTTSPLGGSSKNWNLGRFSRLNWGDRGREGGQKLQKLRRLRLWMVPNTFVNYLIWDIWLVLVRNLVGRGIAGFFKATTPHVFEKNMNIYLCFQIENVIMWNYGVILQCGIHLNEQLIASKISNTIDVYPTVWYSCFIFHYVRKFFPNIVIFRIDLNSTFSSWRNIV